MKKVLIPIVILILAIIVGGTLFLVVSANSPEKKLARQLDLGDRYLSEEDYERAIASFDEALSIDPKCVDAYLAKAEAYEGLEDYDKSIDTLVAGYCSTNDSEIKKALTTKVEERVEELVNNGQIEKAISYIEDIQAKIGDIIFKSLIEELKNQMEVSYSEDDEENIADSGLPYVSIRPLVESATIEGKPWYEWDVDSLSEYYGTVYTENNIDFYDNIENPQYGKNVEENYTAVCVFEGLYGDEIYQGGNRSLVQYKNGRKSYWQTVKGPRQKVVNVSIAAYALENNIVSCESVIDFYNLSEMGMTIDNEIEIETEYGRVKVIYIPNERSSQLYFLLCDENVNEWFNYIKFEYIEFEYSQKGDYFEICFSTEDISF